jgi:hypothetical protein
MALLLIGSPAGRYGTGCHAFCLSSKVALLHGQGFWPFSKPTARLKQVILSFVHSFVSSFVRLPNSSLSYSSLSHSLFLSVPCPSSFSLAHYKKSRQPSGIKRPRSSCFACCRPCSTRIGSNAQPSLLSSASYTQSLVFPTRLKAVFPLVSIHN